MKAIQSHYRLVALSSCHPVTVSTYMMRNYDILLAGDYYCDLIFTGLPVPPEVGTECFGTGFACVPGAAYRTALALHRLELSVGWPCDVGTDFFSRLIIDAAQQDGLDTRLFQHHDMPLQRVSVAFSFAHDRGFISYADQPDRAFPAHLIAQHRPRVVLLSSLQYGPFHNEVAAAARSVGALIYMDCQARAETLDMPEVRAALRQVDVFAPNAAEAIALTGAVTIDAALDQLAALTPLVIIKRGAQGAMAQAGHKRVSVDALPVRVVDTTGAGDCFNAGFVYGILHDYALEDCLRCGAICGSLSTTAHDHSVLPTAPQIEQWRAS